MSPAQLMAYLGPALMAAALLTALLMAALGALRRGNSLPLARLIFLISFFLILTQYPFPDPAHMNCRQGGAQPILQPFAIFDRFAVLATQTEGLWPWIGDKVVQSSGMNLVLCLLIGLALARYLPARGALRLAFALGATLSMTAELLQLTGILGLFPCAYRQFEVDDLILNIGGVVLGAALARSP